MVKHHKKEQRRKQKEIRKQQKRETKGVENLDESSQMSSGEVRMHVREISTGKILRGEDAPLASELEAWLEKNPGYEEAPRDEDADSSDSDDEGKVNPESTEDVIEKAKKEALKHKDEGEAEEGGGGVDYYLIAHTITEEIQEQASIMVGGKLKEYQIKGLEWLVSLYNNSLNGILADEMGLGKTIQTIALVTYLMEKKKNMGPYLVIVPLSTLSNWMFEFEKWAPSCVTLAYKGSPQARRSLQFQMKASKFNTLVTTYEYIIKDKAVLSKVRSFDRI